MPRTNWRRRSQPVATRALRFAAYPAHQACATCRAQETDDDISIAHQQSRRQWKALCRREICFPFTGTSCNQFDQRLCRAIDGCDRHDEASTRASMPKLRSGMTRCATTLTGTSPTRQRRCGRGGHCSCGRQTTISWIVRRGRRPSWSPEQPPPRQDMHTCSSCASAVQHTRHARKACSDGLVRLVSDTSTVPAACSGSWRLVAWVATRQRYGPQPRSNPAVASCAPPSFAPSAGIPTRANRSGSGLRRCALGAH